LDGNIDPVIKLAEKNKIPVVGKGFIESLTELNYSLTDEIKKNLICSWVPDVAAWLKSVNTSYEEKFKEPKGD
jgi:type III secretion system FlhB-like substrate exporter